MTVRPYRVALVSMPFAPIKQPSLQIGLLKGLLDQRGIEAHTFHLNLDMAQRLGYRPYDVLIDMAIPPIAEWLTSPSAFGEVGDETEFVRTWKMAFNHVAERTGWSEADLLRLRHEGIPAFLDACMAEVPWGEYDMVGFSSTFLQHLMSLALARRIKEAHPHVQIVIGGVNVSEPVGREHFKAWTWLDHMCLAEGNALVDLVERLRDGTLGEGVPGFLSRRDGEILDPGYAPLCTDMDSVPDPDYDEYFERVKRLGFNYQQEFPDSMTSLPFEASRGCWWGDKRQCTFCGLGIIGRSFRSRSPEKVLEQLDRLSRRYRTWTFGAVDSIMDPRYVDELFGTIAREGYAFRLGFMVRASLSPRQLCTVSNGGAFSIQPGFESLSSLVLKQMHKGTNGLHNVNILKWARHLGLHIQWNLLTRIPGETAEDYAHMLRNMRRIIHLEPPECCVPIWLQRCSVYFQEPEAHGVRNIRPFPYYASLYPPGTVEPDRIATYFECDMDGTLRAEETRPLRDFVDAWRERWRQSPLPDLFYYKGVDRMQVIDTREPGAPQVRLLGRIQSLVLEACEERPQSRAAICRRLAPVLDATILEGMVDRSLECLVMWGIVLEEGGRYLTVALPDRTQIRPRDAWTGESRREEERTSP